MNPRLCNYNLATAEGPFPLLTMRIALLGKDARTWALQESLKHYDVLIVDDDKNISEQLLDWKPTMAVVGPERMLAAGVVDMLQNLFNIPCIGPTMELAKIETSKAFARQLLTANYIPANPKYGIYRSMEYIAGYLSILKEYVLKPDGLTGGKGVRVKGEHFHTDAEALAYCEEILASHEAVVIEEKLIGQEFSLMSFSDGETVVDAPPVHDYKRRFAGDVGPNTGGMGSYSCANGRLPFLSKELLAQASNINALTIEALYRNTGQHYKGILYGGFIVTGKGLKLIEYNARFGDPEVMNILPLLDTDLATIFEAIINGTLNNINVKWKKKATVVKYIVPTSYPGKSETMSQIGNVPRSWNNLKICYADVVHKDGKIYTNQSRSIAFVGIGDNLAEAESIAEKAASSVTGDVAHREDIGKL